MSRTLQMMVVSDNDPSEVHESEGIVQYQNSCYTDPSELKYMLEVGPSNLRLPVFTKYTETLSAIDKFL